MKQSNVNPTAKIAVKKNVLKQYRLDNVDVVYLAKDAEFEIELFNPLQETVLAKIDMNNNVSIGEGLILRPGERVFLERYLDIDRKFKFDVYSIDGSNASMCASAQNGLVTVKFYREKPTQIYRNDLSVRCGSFGYPVLGNYNTASPYLGSNFTTISTAFVNTTGGNTTGGNSTSTFTINATTDAVQCKSIDTGMVAKGSKSDQEFVEVNQDFQTYPFSTINIKLLPDSLRVMTTEDIKHRKYCSECGSKIKPNDKFCSNCGEKL